MPAHLPLPSYRNLPLLCWHVWLPWLLVSSKATVPPWLVAATLAKGHTCRDEQGCDTGFQAEVPAGTGGPV